MTRAIRVLTLAVATLGLVLPQAASAAGTWQIERGKAGSCTMIATYGGPRTGEDVSIAFVLDPAASGLSFMAASPAWKDLSEREGNPASLLLTFDGSARYTEWMSERTPITRIAGGSRVVVGKWGAEYSEDLARAVTGSNQLVVRVGESDLGTYDIGGSAEAYAKLQRCAGLG